MRCRQVEALFDVPPREKQTLRWSGEVPLSDRPWNVGLIVGPSGCGKSTVARDLFGDAMQADFVWDAPSVIDDFPSDTPLADIAAICNAVGFSTIPAWLRPFRVLSTGEILIEIQRAIELDPTYALAYSSLAEAPATQWTVGGVFAGIGSIRGVGTW